MKFIEGGVCAAQGFKAAGIHVGVKTRATWKKDVALIVSDVDCSAAAVFTKNAVKAAPIHVDKKHLADGKARAIIVNSGNANACTGARGVEDARTECRVVAEQLGLSPSEVAVCSTGVIGLPMPMVRIEPRLPELCHDLSAEKGHDVASAIITSDTREKEVAVEITIGGKPVRIGSCCKGAGMISPCMATMICLICTDAAISREHLDDIVHHGVEHSFNRITIDGDMSTNDTCVIFANGNSGVVLAENSDDTAKFQAALLALMQNLARKQVMDGEGATKFVAIEVDGAPDTEGAKRLAEAVANSLLCKTAWFGCDPNWGRVVAALGYAKVDFNPDLVNIYYDGIPVVRDGGDAGTPEEDLADVMKKREFTVLCDMNCGDVDYWVWTSDVTYEYVKINATCYLFGIYVLFFSYFHQKFQCWQI